MARKPRIDYWELFDLFAWGLGKLARPTICNLLAGYDEYAEGRGMDACLRRLEAKKLLRKSGRGEDAVFTITERARAHSAELNPKLQWDKRWDGAWRAVTFDLPESRRKDRLALWRALRAARLGFLQRSVWVWPHEMESMLSDIIKAEGIPECFCGFETRRLFLCSDAEVVESSWDFEEIAHRHGTYLKHQIANSTSVARAKNLPDLVNQSRIERGAYRYAFSIDPLLPRALWPRGYRGPAVERKHEGFRAAVHRRMGAFARELRK